MDGLMTDLNQLVIFAKVVEVRSFTAAGRALGLPKSTISRKVAQLEERLGVQLLQRTTRRIALTDSGAAFNQHCLRITADIAEAERSVGRDQSRPHGVLRIGASRELGTRFLAASVNAFLTIYPEIDIELGFGGRAIDPHAEGLDLVLRLDRRVESGVLIRDLGPLYRCVVASPRYLAEHARAGTSEYAWIASRELPLLGARPRLVVDDLGLVREAVLAGLGVGLLPVHECQADLDEGRLVAIGREPAEQRLEVTASYPVSRQLSTKVCCFVEFLGERLAQFVEVSEPEPESDSESVLESDSLSSGSALYSGHSAGVGEVTTQP